MNHPAYINVNCDRDFFKDIYLDLFIYFFVMTKNIFLSHNVLYTYKKDQDREKRSLEPKHREPTPNLI